MKRNIKTQIVTRLYGNPNQYYILKVFLGDTRIAVHTSKKIGYLNKLAKQYRKGYR